MTTRQILGCAAVASLAFGILLLLLRKRVRFGGVAGSFLLGLSVGILLSAALIPLSPWEVYGVE
jgi:hypothetical protein